MSTIESVLQENRVFPPSPELVKQANVSGMDEDIAQDVSTLENPAILDQLKHQAG